MISYEEAGKQVESLSVRQREFYQLVGLCIKAWASVEDKLFDVCQFALKTNPRLVSIVYYRTPTIDSRLKLADELLRTVLPQKTQIDIEWNGIMKEIAALLPTRNSLAHDPVVLNIDPNPTAEARAARILWPTESLEVATSQKEKLRGLKKRQVKDTALQQHLADVNTVVTKLAEFVSDRLLKMPP